MEDGSTDDTREILATFAARDPRIHWYRHPNRLGLTPSLIELAAEARGEYFMRQDADDWSALERMNMQSQVLQARPAVGVVSSWVAMHDDQGHDLGLSKTFSSTPLLKRQLRHRNPIVHGSLMIRASSYRNVGGYRPFFAYAQDYDLLLRLLEKEEMAVVPAPLYHLRLTQAGIGRTKLIEQEAYASLSRACASLRRQGLADQRAIDAFKIPPQTGQTENLLIGQATQLLKAGHRSQARSCLRQSSARSLSEVMMKSFLYALSLFPKFVSQSAACLRHLWELR